MLSIRHRELVIVVMNPLRKFLLETNVFPNEVWLFTFSPTRMVEMVTGMSIKAVIRSLTAIPRIQRPEISEIRY